MNLDLFALHLVCSAEAMRQGLGETLGSGPGTSGHHQAVLEKATRPQALKELNKPAT